VEVQSCESEMKKNLLANSKSTEFEGLFLQLICGGSCFWGEKRDRFWIFLQRVSFLLSLGFIQFFLFLGFGKAVCLFRISRVPFG